MPPPTHPTHRHYYAHQLHCSTFWGLTCCSYAFGVVLWELVSWEIPYAGLNTWLVRCRF